MYNIGGKTQCSNIKIFGVSAVVKNLLSNRATRENKNFLDLVMSS